MAAIWRGSAALGLASSSRMAAASRQQRRASSVRRGRTAQRGALRRRAALDPAVIVRRGSSRAVTMAAAGMYEDVRPMRFNLAGTRTGVAVVAP